jgi:hypothetical protein
MSSFGERRVLNPTFGHFINNFIAKPKMYTALGVSNGFYISKIGFV